MNLLKAILSIIFIFASANAIAKDIDWNEGQLKWYSYEEGMQLAKSTDKKAMLVIYADWCPTCQSYGKLFHSNRVLNSLEDLILIKVDRDESIEISEKYAFDGEYVPRTIALNPDGTVMHELYPADEKYRYYLLIDSLNISNFIQKIKDYQANSDS